VMTSGNAGGPIASGHVHVYRLQAGGQWSRTKSIASPTPNADDYFPTGVSLEGDTLVVGAPHDEEAGFRAGAAYIFRRSATRQGDAAADAGPGEDWTLLRKWLPPEAEGRACYSLALSGDSVFCGAPAAFGGGGAAYVFSLEGDDSADVLRPPVDEQSTTKSFGFVVAIDGDTAAVAPDGTVNEDRGTAYVFRRVAGKWEHYRKIGTGASTVQYFPIGLAVDGPTFIATSPIEPDSSYVFHVPLAGTD
jgi:hypothetical protein